MKCKYCRKVLTGTEKFCPECGKETGYKIFKIKEDFTIEEKCKVFDELQEMAKEYFNSIVSGQSHEDSRSDEEHYMYEAIMVKTLTNGENEDELWKTINRHS